MARKKKSLTSQKIFWIFLGLALVIVAILALLSSQAPQADVLPSADITNPSTTSQTNTADDPAVQGAIEELGKASLLAACPEHKDNPECQAADTNKDGTVKPAEIEAAVQDAP